MARKTQRAPLELTDESRKILTVLSGSMTAPAREVIRAKVLLHYANGVEISNISVLSESVDLLFINALTRLLRPESTRG